MTNTNTSNRFNNHGNAVAASIAIIGIIVGVLYLQSWWLQSIIFEFTKVVYSQWITFAVLLLVEFFTPKNLQGLPLFLMFIAQCYIWFFMVR